MNWKRKSYKTNLKRQCHNWICWTIELNTQTVCLNENKLIDTIISYCYTYLCCLYFTWTNVCVAWFSFHGFTITCLTTILRVDTSSRPWMGATPASNWACTPACPTSPFGINLMIFQHDSTYIITMLRKLRVVELIFEKKNTCTIIETTFQYLWTVLSR